MIISLEYRQYKAKTLSEVEKTYLDTIKDAQKKVGKRRGPARKREAKNMTDPTCKDVAVQRLNGSKIEKLIAELCPDLPAGRQGGVEFKDVGTLIEDKTVTTVTPPKKLTKKHYKPTGTFPIIDQGQNFIVGYTNDSNAVVANDLYVIFGDHTEAIKYVNFAFVQGADGIKILKTHTDIINTRFFYYVLNNFYEKIGKYTRHFSFLKKTKIPIPPLAIQQEIVNILNTFTTLEAELEAELEARKKQYAYYRDELLTPIVVSGKWLMVSGEEVEWKTLGEVITLKYGKTLKENERDGGNFPVLGSNGRIGFHSSYLIEGPCIIIGRKGSAGAVVWEEKNCYPIDTTFFVKNQSDKILLKYLFYKFQTFNLTTDKQDGGVPGINRNNVYKIKIPIPPLAEQERIVAILDKFDALVNDISVGLPAELNARRRQYEYYRNKLLTFKPLEKEHAS